jgi:hypothetical protein
LDLIFAIGSPREFGLLVEPFLGQVGQRNVDVADGLFGAREGAAEQFTFEIAAIGSANAQLAIPFVLPLHFFLLLGSQAGSLRYDTAAASMTARRAR